ncbi:allantoate deiminase [Bacillus massiliglaciei]|uniref:allantoate deiminase n=1 Tax=Bacillus massiliglaciei TaxID=1816693 RepID=UPI000DA5FEA3|nr:allantoate deiminase [Bacillus massiliglaciei]
MAMRLEGHQVNKDRAADWIEWLAEFGKAESGGVTRLLYSPSWRMAQNALKRKWEQEGFETYFDTVGNLFGRLNGSDPSEKTILTGSHIDTVINGGKYDGALGVIAGFLAVKRLKEKYGQPKRTLEIVSLCEEEGSRFPITFWGSRNIQGRYSLKDVQQLQDKDGIPFLTAMEEAGFPKEVYTEPVRTDIGCYVELHIEQGMVLERKNKSIGVVSHIVGQRRYTIRISGESNHAGTTPMAYRKDAVVLAAQFITYLTEEAKRIDPDLVVTVGKAEISPNVPNVIAGMAEFSVDMRHYKEEVLAFYCERAFEYMQQSARKSMMDVKVDQWMDVKPVAMNREMAGSLKEIAVQKNIPYMEMVSGAGHDAQVFGSFCPAAMLFVPSKDGISHSPKEYTKAADLEKGIDILEEFLYQYAY